MQYTQIEIKFVPSILDANDTILGDSIYTIEIISPVSSRPGSEQSIPSRVIRKIVIGETLILKLLPSDLYLPLGKYQVIYRKLGQKHPVFQEKWIVPSYPETKVFTYTLLPTDSLITLPLDYYSTYGITGWNSSFESTYNQILFHTLPLTPTRVDITYNTKVTRDRLIYKGT